LNVPSEYTAALEARRELARLFASDEGVDLAIYFARSGNPDYPWSPPQTQRFIEDMRDLLGTQGLREPAAER
jgi:hypothetical protein